MPDIAIVGAGISGVHLALRLQRAGVSTTLYAERDLDDVAAGPPLNLVVRFDQTRQRERDLGVAHWESTETNTYGMNVAAAVAPPVGFFGRFNDAASAVDFRIYLPRLVADYADRGGKFVVSAIDDATIESLARHHDLVVVATGRRGGTSLFPRDEQRSPYAVPQRRLTAALYRGIAPSDPSWVHFQLCPEVGEVFSTRMLTFDGLVHGMVIEGIEGGPLARLADLDHQDDPRLFERTVLSLLAEHAPPLRERIDEREFGLARPIDLIQGGITPTVRSGWAPLPDGKFALALGDAWVVNDPLSGQGANLASRCAIELADEILDASAQAGSGFDEAFCRRVEQRLWAVAQPVVSWSNLTLGPPSEDLIKVLMAGTENGAAADTFAENFNDPQAMWDMVSSPANNKAWLARFGG